MKTVYPDYLSDFRCIADKCRHSCCIGWEIDIDPDSLDRYMKTDAPLGEKLRKNIDVSEDCACFILSENERCPFLLENGLCELIVEKDSDFLCDICSDHPRFRNYFSDRIEIGLGLCCEAAAKLITENPEKVSFISESSDPDTELPEDEQYIIDFRDTLIDIAQDRSLQYPELERKICRVAGISFNPDNLPDLTELFKSLEKLSDDREIIIESLSQNRFLSVPVEFRLFCEQLVVYFLFRHIPDALYDDRLRERVAFCLLSVRVITQTFIFHKSPMADAARIYSSEIEYSQENMDALLDYLGNHI